MLANSSDLFFLWTNCTNAASGPSLERILAPFTVGARLRLTVRAHTPRRLLVGQKENSLPRKTQRASSCIQALIPEQDDISRAEVLSVYLYSGSTYSITQCDTFDCFAFRVWYSQCIADCWPRCRYSPAYCAIAVFHKSEIHNRVCEPSETYSNLDSCKLGASQGIC